MKTRLSLILWLVVSLTPLRAEVVSFDTLWAKVSAAYDSLSGPAEELIPQFAELEAHYRAYDPYSVVDKYTHLPDAKGIEMNRMKFLLQAWRTHTRIRTLERIRSNPFSQTIRILRALNSPLDVFDIEQVLHRWRQDPDGITPEMIYDLLIDIGDRNTARSFLPAEYRRRLDPLYHPAVPILPGFRWNRSAWRDPRYQGDYIWDGDCVVIRQNRICHGDLLLVDLALPFDGVNTSFSNPRSSFTHSGVVVFFEQNGERRPFVFEIHLGGVRLVPLARYLSPSYVYYAEVARVRDHVARDPDWKNKLGKVTMAMMARQMGYDFSAQPIPEEGYAAMCERGQNEAVCSTLMHAVFLSAGVKLDIPVSYFGENLQKNLIGAGFPKLAAQGFYQTPTDWKRSRDIEITGIIDNDFEHNVVREFILGSNDVVDSFGDWISHRTLRLQGLPGNQGKTLYRTVQTLFTLNRLMGELSPLNGLLAWGPRNLPRASARGFSTTVVMSNRLEKAFPLCAQEVADRIREAKPFDLQVVEKSPKVRNAVRKAFTEVGLDKAFRPF